MFMAVEREVSSTAATTVKARAKRATESVNLDEMVMMSNVSMTGLVGGLGYKNSPM
jgi:hypothetical protein